MGGRVAALLLALALVGAACAGAAGSHASQARTATSATSTGVATGNAGAAGGGAPAGTSPASARTTSGSTADGGAPAPSATALRPAAVGNWPGYHGGGAESGYAPVFPAPNHPTVAWNAALDGAVYGQPIVVGGTIIAATENDTVYGLDPVTGAVRWRTHVGTPVRLSTLPCGNIDPLGITSTPVFDATTGSVFVVAETRGPSHRLYALNAATGAVRWSILVDLPGELAATRQQRAALLVANGKVYVGFGGLAGDCGQYKGEVVAVPTSGVGSRTYYRVPVRREGAVWSGGAGPIVDAAGHLYVSIGNGSSTTVYDGSDSVVELSRTPALLSRFAPRTWAWDNLHDADLGSMAPALVAGGYVFIAGKSGRGYVLRQGRLGGVGGQVSSAAVCAGYGGAAVVKATVFVPCSSGIQRVTIDIAGRIHLGWRTATGANGPPVYGGGAVWSISTSTGVLYALSGATGGTLAQIALGPVPHFASPTLWGGLVLVGTMRGVAAVRAAP